MPWIVTAIFLLLLLILRLLIGGLLSLWICGLYLALLLGTVFYSLGVNGRITEYIDENMTEPRD